MGKQHDRRQHEYDQGVDQQKAEILAFASQQRRQGEINQVSLFAEKINHGSAVKVVEKLSRMENDQKM